MRKTIATVTTAILLALPMTAGAADEASANIEFFGDTPKIERTSTVDGIRFDVVGHHLNVQVDGEAVTSVRIPQDAIALAIAADGSVTFTLAEEQGDEPLPEPIFETPLTYEEIYEAWRTEHHNIFE